MTGLGLSDAQTVVAPGQQEFRAACFENGNEGKKSRIKLEHTYLSFDQKLKSPDLSGLLAQKS